MDLGFLAKHAEKLVKDNAPAILSAIGATGVVVTAILAGKATFRSAAIIAEEEGAIERLEADVETGDLTGKEKDAEIARQLENDGMSVTDIAVEMSRPEKTIMALLKLSESSEKIAAQPPRILDNRAKFGLIWKEYVPAVVIGTITITAIFGANHISTRRAAALASAFSISQKLTDEYQDKVLKKIGKNKEQQIRDEVAQDQADRTPISKSQEVYLLQPGGELWLDARTGRFFRSDMETVRAAVNDLNQIILSVGHASLSDFYEMIHLDHTSESDELGWTTDKLLHVDYTAVNTRLGPAVSMLFKSNPIRNFYIYG